MKTNDKKEIFSKNLPELRKSLKDARNESFQMILENTQFKLKNNRQIYHKKKEIARILTALKEHELKLPKGEAVTK